jgi:cellulose synthase/poly-beta-1,6-N-acetylglucosamine synthase-like glycosyltransferase/sugar lactone lactonase YvrE
VFGPDDDLYVVSSAADEIVRFSGKTGDFVSVFASGGGLDSPVDLSLDRSGFFYVSSGNTDQILRYLPDGTFKDVFVNSGEIKTPQGLVFGPDDDLYVVSNATNEIFRISKTSTPSIQERFIYDFSSALYQPKNLEVFNGKICVSSFLTDDIKCYDEKTGTSLGNLVVSFNRGFAIKENSIIGPDGELYVTDSLRNEIRRYDGITGIFSDVVINTENDQLQGPTYLTFGPDDNLYVGSADNRILRFDGKSGDFMDVFVLKNKGGLNNPHGLLFNENYFFVSSTDNNRLLRYDSINGMFIDEFIGSRDHDMLGPIGAILDKNGHIFISSSVKNKILQYNVYDGKFVDEFNLQYSPHGIVFGDDNILYISSFDTNEIYRYDVITRTSHVLISEKDGLFGPEGLAFDEKNHILYVSSSRNNKIISFDLQNNIASVIRSIAGNGILQNPQGLTIHNDALYISNKDNLEVLKYEPQTKTMVNFIYNAIDPIKPGGITFGPDHSLYVINENNYNVYRYDFKKGEMLDVFTNLQHSQNEDITNVKPRNIVFTKDEKYLFASSPSNNEILIYDAKTGMFLKTFSKLTDVLQYPTDLIITPDGEHVLVNNYGTNTILRFTLSGDFDKVFVTPGDNGLFGIKKIRFGQDGNLYVSGGEYNNILKYDGTTGQYIGEFEIGGIYFGKLDENLLNTKYSLNEIDTRQYDTVVIYDHFLERPYGKITLYDNSDITALFSTAWNSFTYNFDIVPEPKLESKKVTKHTGFLIGLNDTAIYGQAITKTIDFTSLITIEDFFVNYDKNNYLSIKKINGVFTNGPQLYACLVPSESSSICRDSNGAIELGQLHINAGDNRFLVKDIDLNKYRKIVIYDKTSGDTIADIPLRDYGILRISGESFLDWLQHDFMIFPILTIFIIIFPLIFDYTRTIFKIFFFSIHLVLRKSDKKSFGDNYNPKITILIPAHNEEYGIQESIKAALETDYTNKEIIVIDDGSKDNTYLIANSFAEQGLIKLVHRDTASGSKATALNYGMNYATGDYILCMDGDTKLDKYALKNAVKHFSNENVVALSGNVRIFAGDNGINNLLTKLQTYEYMIAIELGRRFTSIFQILLVISGAFGIFRRDVIRSVHTFDKDTLTEDFDLTLKLRKTRGMIQFVGNSIAYTYCPNNWQTWKKQRNRWAYGQFQTLSKNKNILTSKFPFKDKLAFIDMFLLDVVLAILFPIGLAVLGIISVIMIMADTLHVLLYPLTFVMSVFLISEIMIFLLAKAYSGKSNNLKLIYLAPVMTFFYRPYLRMVNLRAFLRSYLRIGSSW